MDFIKSNLFIVCMFISNIIFLVLYIINVVRVKELNKNYNTFMKKIGNGNNIDEMLKRYINEVNQLEKNTNKIYAYCKELENNLSICIQKTGLVRYNAFKDTGSDLSFALALLDNKNNGVILNGIYSREMSNIYAKQVKNGGCSSKISEEEKQALDEALNI